MVLRDTLLRVQKTLPVTQKGLARLLGCSSRTVIRYYQRGGVLLPGAYERLATACHPHDPAFAAELAALAGKTLVELGLEPPPPPPPPPPPRLVATSSRHIVDSVVCAAAEAMQTTPQAIRPALKAAFQRAMALGMGAEEVLRGMGDEAAAECPGA
jgi:hypothetical protein